MPVSFPFPNHPVRIGREEKFARMLRFGMQSGEWHARRFQRVEKPVALRACWRQNKKCRGRYSNLAVAGLGRGCSVLRNDGGAGIQIHLLDKAQKLT